MTASPRIILQRRLTRAAIGACWAAPFRLVTIPAIAGAMMVSAGGVLTPANLLQPEVMASGIGVSIVLRFIDNLMVEFALFPAVINFMKGLQK